MISHLLLGLLAASSAQALKYDPLYEGYNLNENKEAQNPLEYSGSWDQHSFHPSPDNWRFPFYTLFLDRFVNGDPTNDNANETLFEQDIYSTQLRHGGDLQGLVDSLDYIQGLGIKGLYIAGSPFINQPWVADSYSPLDHTLLDQHFGNITEWRRAVSEIHRRGMYILLDNTVATMGDLIGFNGYLNESTPYDPHEHSVLWKGTRRYHDFDIGQDYNETCDDFPRLWSEDGFPVGEDVMAQFSGCYNGDFDQFGDTEAFGVYPDYRRQLTKFASVQDRLREWSPSVMERLVHFSCLAIQSLDIDGFRLDKATQVTLDASGAFSAGLRACARRAGKANFFIPGEITGGNTFGALYVGRGRQPDQYARNLTAAVSATNETAAAAAASTSSGEEEGGAYVREPGLGALDAAAFHYSIYRFLTRFLGMDGNLEAGFDLPRNFVDGWNEMLLSNDFVNANTGAFDPRHMYGVTNQDVFRWPGVAQGTERMLLGQFVTTLLLPGIPLLLWGEEQAFYVLDSTADNYIYGRQAISPSPAWELHGCYAGGSTQYFEMPLTAAREGCRDPTQSLDHRDPAHPVRNIVKSLYHMRAEIPALNDGLFLQQLSNHTEHVQYPGSNTTATETGLWSVLRSAWQDGGVQDFGGSPSVWLVYHNRNETTEYEFDCSASSPSPLVAPFPAGSRVKNLVFPHDELALEASPRLLGINGSAEANGCARRLTMRPYEFRAYVPKADFVPPPPMITRFLPGHDAQIESSSVSSGAEARSNNMTVPIELHASVDMDCDSFTAAVEVESTTDDDTPSPRVDRASVKCGRVAVAEEEEEAALPALVGAISSAWRWSADLVGVADGVHRVTVRNATTEDLGSSTGSADHFLLRVGSRANPVAFPKSGNYSATLLRRDRDADSSSSEKEGAGQLWLDLDAPGASMFRYSTNWGSSWSGWAPYRSGRADVARQPWAGTPAQAWEGEHVIVQYWSRLLGSSSFVQHGDLVVDDAGTEQPLRDLNKNQTLAAAAAAAARRFPHLNANGDFNQFGYDAGLRNAFQRTTTTATTTATDGQQQQQQQWSFHVAAEWPTSLQLNVWGMNPDGQPDQSFVYGDVDGDGVLDRLPPSSLVENVVNITAPPPWPHLAWRLAVDDATLRYALEGRGDAGAQLALYVLLWLAPVASGALVVLAFVGSFYKVKFNQMGLLGGRRGATVSRFLSIFGGGGGGKNEEAQVGDRDRDRDRETTTTVVEEVPPIPTSAAAPAEKRRTVLIGTMEYNIDDWDIKIKIGGLGVMAQLMGKALAHQDLVWVVPCVGGIEYPVDTPAAPMEVTILGRPYRVGVQYHAVGNITYVLLDAPVFRQQTRAEPYPARMDDLDSAVYYSAWNQCIAEAARRFPVDLYHINDYHGAAAPLYLLPRLIPCCLSLHNAEFQGMWPMRTPAEAREVCDVFNLAPDVVKAYVQFGAVFNLLNAGSSYLRIHQRGFGAVGVSKKYGARSFARYAIFWGLDRVGQLPNPDPTDTADWDPAAFARGAREGVAVDEALEGERAGLKRQAQDWAGLEPNPDAQLFVFVGRWSLQKGVDLIADVFPWVLDAYPDTQLICVGPVIDLYGRFAALKLARLMQLYPGRVYSKPEFTALPPYIFSGAEFALIPSRDEPFGLVAVEFGRKGALGVGARVGGLGQVPGWWYTVESTSAGHLLAQFKGAIVSALETDGATRALMRAWSAKQRFPVAQWLKDLETLQSTAVAIRAKEDASSGGGGGGGGEAHHRRLSRFVGAAVGPRSIQNRLSKHNPAAEAAGGQGAGAPPGLSIEQAPEAASADDAEGCQTRDVSGDQDGASSGVSRTSRSGMHIQLPPPARLGPDSPSPLSSAPPTPGLSVHGESDDARSDSQPGTPGIAWHQEQQQQQQQQNDEATPTTSLSPGSVALRRDDGSALSLADIKGTRSDFKLQRVDPFFTDERGEFYSAFDRKLGRLDARNSTTELCIEAYLVRSEKAWFSMYRDAKLGKNPLSSTAASTADPSREPSLDPASGRGRRGRVRVREVVGDDDDGDTVVDSARESRDDEESGRRRGGGRAAEVDPKEYFGLPDDYVPPSGIRKHLQYRIGEWPLYSILLALSQVIASNSYQVTLLTGEVGQTATKLYAVAGVYLAATLLWYALSRTVRAVYPLALPFFVYGLAFLVLGVSPFVSADGGARGWVQNVATGLYAVASASGGITFALNFGDEGGAPVSTWIYRAAVIQGLQQLYALGLWYWGSLIASSAAAGIGAQQQQHSLSGSPYLLAVCGPLAAGLFAAGGLLLAGLPEYYRQTPGAVPALWRSLLRRRTIVWYFFAVALQNYFLSPLYGRNWFFLFGSRAVSPGLVALLAIGFLAAAWAGILWALAAAGRSHPWVFPLFAVGLGAPRWAQMLWGTSGVGLWLPWAAAAAAGGGGAGAGGGAVASAVASRCLWLWLGLLDGIQGAGVGMILMLTLTRVHVEAAVVGAQVLGSVATMAGRASAPNRVGPADVFPDLTEGVGEALGRYWFWVVLALQLLICAGYLKFFRKDQVSKP